MKSAVKRIGVLTSGGDDISREAMRGAFAHLEALAAGEGASGEVVFFGVEEEGGKR